MKNVILVDFNIEKEWEFHRCLEDYTKEKWDIMCLQSNQNHGGSMQTLIRYVKYFVLPAKVFLKRRQYKHVLAWQQFFGLILACYLRLFQIEEAPEITVMTFIFNPKKHWVGKMYYLFVRYAVSSRYIKSILVYSETERSHYAELFSVSEKKFCTVKIGVEDEREKYAAHLSKKKYYVSAGRSNRDYDFLHKAWENNSKQLRIICDSIDEKNDPNIVYLTKCHDDAYLKELAGCYAVIIPLVNEDISSGQLVLLHAMMLGKPAVITKNLALQEYVQDGITGFIIEKTELALSDTLKKLEDDQLYMELSKNARKYFEENYTQGKLGESVAQILCSKN